MATSSILANVQKSLLTLNSMEFKVEPGKSLTLLLSALAMYFKIKRNQHSTNQSFLL